MIGGLLPPVVAHLIAETGEFAAKMGEAEALTKRVTGASGASWAQAGKAAMGVGGIMAAAAGTVALETIKMASDFNTQMERVHTQAGASQQEVDGLKSKVLDLAAATGQGPEKLAEALYHVESVGYRGATAMAVLDNASKLASISGANLDDTTYGLTSVMQTYGAKAQDAAKWAAFFNSVVGAGDMKMEDFNKAVGTGYFSAAQTFGMSSQSAGAALAFMTDRGQHADAAATNLRMSLALIAAPSQKATTILHGLGLTATDVATAHAKVNGVLAKSKVTYSQLADDLKKPDGFVVALTHLKKGLMDSGLSAEAANAQLSHAFGGGKSDSTILAMLNNLDTLKSKYDAVGKGMGSFAESYKASAETAAGQMARLKASAQGLGIEIGNALMPYFVAFLGWVKQGTDWMRTHEGAVKAIAFGIGVLLVAGLALATAGAIAFAIATAEVWVPIFLIIIAIVALVAGLMLLVTHWKQVWGWIVSIAKDVGGWLAQTWNAIKSDAMQLWGELVDWVKGKWDELVGWFASGWSSVSDTTSSWWDSIVGAIKGAWNAVTGWLSSAWHAVVDPIVAGWHQLQAATTAVWNGILDWFKKWWPLLLVIFAPFVAIVVAIWNHFHTQILNAVHTAWNTVTGFLRATWATITRLASEAWGWLVDQWDSFNNLIQSVARTVWDAVTGFLKQVWADIVAVARAAWALFYDHVVQPVQQAYHFVVYWLGVLGADVRRIFNTAVANVRAAWNAFYGVVVDPVVRGVQAVGRLLSQLWHDVTSWFGSTLSSARNIAGQFWNVGASIVQGVINGVEAYASQAWNTVVNFANGLLNAAKSFLGINSPSRLFRDTIGKGIPEGVAVGVDLHARVATNSVSGLAAKLQAAGRVAMTSTPMLSVSSSAMQAVTASSMSTVHATVQVVAKVDGKVLFETQQEKALQYQRRNSAPAFSS